MPADDPRLLDGPLGPGGPGGPPCPSGPLGPGGPPGHGVQTTVKDLISYHSLKNYNGIATWRTSDRWSGVRLSGWPGLALTAGF